MENLKENPTPEGFLGKNGAPNLRIVQYNDGNFMQQVAGVTAVYLECQTVQSAEHGHPDAQLRFVPGRFNVATWTCTLPVP